MNTWGEGSHGIYIQFTRAGTAITEPHCMLDGMDSPEVCKLAENYAWPEGSYLLKQYFAFAEGPLPEDVTARPDLPELEAQGE